MAEDGWTERDALLRAGYIDPGAPCLCFCCRCPRLPCKNDWMGKRERIFLKEMARGFKLRVALVATAEGRFDDEPRDLVGLTVFVKEYGEGDVLEYSKARTPMGSGS